MRAPDIDSAALHEAMRDDQLMLAYVSGDTAAFDVLYGRHEGPLYRFVCRLMGTGYAAEVDGVFQETWMHVVTARESFALQGVQWRPWAFTIAHNLAVERMRGREHMPVPRGDDADAAGAALLPRRGAPDDGAPELEITQASAEDATFWRAAGKRMLESLDELSLEQRSAFLLHHEEGFSLEAMAATLDMKVDTVRSRLLGAQRKLRNGMDQYLAVLGTHG